MTLKLDYSRIHTETHQEYYTISSLKPLIDSYHPPLDFILSISTPEFLSETSCAVVFNFNACNYNDVNLFLNSIDLMSNLINLNVDLAVLKLNEILSHSFDMFVPKIKLNYYDSRSLYRSNPILRYLIKLKRQAHKKYKLIHIQITYFFLTYVVIVKNCLFNFM
jgi:hypothetical protein